MKHIQLECHTRGFAHGAIVAVGKGKDEIPVAEAQSLVDEGFAKVWDAPVVSKQVSGVDLDTANAKIVELQTALESSIKQEDLDTANAKIVELQTALDASNTQVVMLQSEVDAAKGALNGKVHKAAQ